MTTALASILMILPAMAGYGDVDEFGLPSWAERDVHIWTNAVRVDPEAFSADYEAGGCSFDSFLPAEKVKLPPLKCSDRWPMYLPSRAVSASQLLPALSMRMV